MASSEVSSLPHDPVGPHGASESCGLTVSTRLLPCTRVSHYLDFLQILKSASHISLSFYLKYLRLDARKMLVARVMQGSQQCALHGAERHDDAAGRRSVGCQINVRKCPACSLNVLVVKFDACPR